MNYYFRNLIILEIRQKWKIDDFRNCKSWEIFGIMKIEIFGIFQIGIFGNFTIWKINKFLEFFPIGKPKFGSKHWQILELFDYSIFRNFANFDIFPLI